MSRKTTVFLRHLRPHIIALHASYIAIPCAIHFKHVCLRCHLLTGHSQVQQKTGKKKPLNWVTGFTSAKNGNFNTADPPADMFLVLLRIRKKGNSDRQTQHKGCFLQDSHTYVQQQLRVRPLPGKLANLATVASSPPWLLLSPACLGTRLFWKNAAKRTICRSCCNS